MLLSIKSIAALISTPQYKASTPFHTGIKAIPAPVRRSDRATLTISPSPEIKRHQLIPVSVSRRLVNYILLTFSCSCASLYFKRVALPPLMCLSDLFLSKTFLTSLAAGGFSLGRRSVTSLWTVLLLTPNFFAVCLTVDSVLIIYSAISMALRSM